MKRITSIIAVLLCVALLAAACTPAASTSSGASASPEASASSAASSDPSASPSGSALADDTVMATVNGESILYKDYNNQLTQLCYQYYVTPDQLDDTMGVEYANEFRKYAVNGLITTEVVYQEACAQGMDKLTEAETAEVKSRLDENISSLKEQLKESIEAAHEDDKDYDVDAELEIEYKDYLDTNGYTEEYLLEMYTRNFIIEKYVKTITDPITVSDEEVKAYYDTTLKEKQEQEKTDSAAACAAYDGGTNTVQLIVPAGMRKIKNLLVGIPDDEQVKIDDETDETKKKELLTAALEKIKPEAAEVYKKLKAGGDFDALVAEYGDDSGMTTEPAKTEGYTVYDGAGFVEEFLKESLALEKVGDYSKPFTTKYGYHIVLYVADVEAKVVPLADVTENIKNQLITEKQNEAWNAKQTELEAAADIERNEDLYIMPIPAESEEPSASAEATATPEPEDINDPSASPDVD